MYLDILRHLVGEVRAHSLLLLHSAADLHRDTLQHTTHSKQTAHLKEIGSLGTLGAKGARASLHLALALSTITLLTSTVQSVANSIYFKKNTNHFFLRLIGLLLFIYFFFLKEKEKNSEIKKTNKLF